jgi:hypothetical protein
MRDFEQIPDPRLICDLGQFAPWGENHGTARASGWRHGGTPRPIRQPDVTARAAGSWRLRRLDGEEAVLISARAAANARAEKQIPPCRFGWSDCAIMERSALIHMIWMPSLAFHLGS